MKVSGCWSKDYYLSLLELVGDNLLDRNSWKKYTKPIFKSTKEIIGPGHCSFIKKKNKKNIDLYMFFHSFNDITDLSLENFNARYIKIALKILK